MIFSIQLITIAIAIFIQRSTQVPIMKRNLKLYAANTEPDGSELQHITLHKQKLTKGNKKPAKLTNKNKNKLSQQTDDDIYVDFDNYGKDNVMKYNEQGRRPEYDAYGKRYYRVATKDVNGDGVQHDMYEDDFGTRYYKLYVIDDRSGYVVINGIRYQRASQQRPVKMSNNKKVPLNQQIYSNTIQNFEQNNVFNKLLAHKKAPQSHQVPQVEIA